MRIGRFIWLDAIIDELGAKYGVAPAEFEEVLSSRPRIRYQVAGHRPDEDMYAAYGVADAGRYLMSENREKRLTSISKADSYEAIGECWDTHSSTGMNWMRTSTPFSCSE